MGELDHRIKDLIIKHLKDELTVEQQLELQQWINASDHNSDVFRQLTEPGQLSEDLKEYYEAKINIRDKIEARIRTFALPESPVSNIRPVRRRRWIYASAAAALLFLLITSYFWLASRFDSSSKARPVPASVAVRDVAPGGNKATLTLGNGATIVLENAADGSLAVQGGVQVFKIKDRLAYKVATPGIEILYNTLTTPRGGQYQLTLPDGTRVWLNAASSIKYPTAFVGKDRIVEMTGEIYFEVVHNNKHPFKVKAGNQTIEDIGTSFNINAYVEEPTINTTLLEGAVKIKYQQQEIKLNPGQQLQSSANGKLKILSNINTEQVLAWKNGLFYFHSSDIQTVMKQLARWYDVEIDYEGIKTSNTLTAVIRRDNMASDVLQVLEASGYHFRIEGKKIKVLP